MLGALSEMGNMGRRGCPFLFPLSERQLQCRRPPVEVTSGIRDPVHKFLGILAVYALNMLTVGTRVTRLSSLTS
jgi:hypothetical protein